MTTSETPSTTPPDPTGPPAPPESLEAHFAAKRQREIEERRWRVASAGAEPPPAEGARDERHQAAHQAAQTNEALAAAAQEARIIREARMPGKGPLSDQQLESIRAQARQYLDEKRVTAAQVAKQVALSASTVSSFLVGSYAGNNEKVARKIVNWIEQHARGEKTGLPEGVVTTGVIEKMIGLAQMVVKSRKVGIVTGGAGNGKTLFAKALAGGNVSAVAHAVHVEVDPGHRNARSFTRLLAKQLGLGALSQSLDVLMEKVIDHLTGRRWLLVIDQAHELDQRALEVILAVHKKTDTPVLFLATRLFNRLADDMESLHGQFASHVVFRYDIEEAQELGGDPVYTVDEIARLAASMGLKLEGDGAEFLTELACIPGYGGFRWAASLLFKANLLALHQRTDRVGVKQLQAAIRNSNNQRHIQRLEAVRKRKTARVA